MKRWIKLTVAAAVIALTWLVLEGIHAIAQWNKFDASVAFKTYTLLKQAYGYTDLPSYKAGAIEEPFHGVLVKRDEIESLIPKLKLMHAGVGNSPYTQLQDEKTGINTYQDGCLTQKARIKKTTMYLRSNLFNPLDPPKLFYDSDVD